jgi:maltose O-acetyltransferase
MRTERDKMLAGELYDARDPALVTERHRVRELCQKLNASRDAEEDLRRDLCKQIFAKGGDTVWMQPPFYCDYGSNIELGERVFFNFNCVVLDVCHIRIGDYTLFGPAVQVLTPMHPLDSALRREQEYGKPVEIGSDVWVGAGALILPGVTIGSGTVIGAGSVVTRDVPAGVFAAGNPCRVIRPGGAGILSDALIGSAVYPPTAAAIYRRDGRSPGFRPVRGHRDAGLLRARTA